MNYAKKSNYGQNTVHWIRQWIPKLFFLIATIVLKINEITNKKQTLLLVKKFVKQNLEFVVGSGE